MDTGTRRKMIFEPIETYFIMVAVTTDLPSGTLHREMNFQNYVRV